VAVVIVVVSLLRCTKVQSPIGIASVSNITSGGCSLESRVDFKCVKAEDSVLADADGKTVLQCWVKRCEVQNNGCRPRVEGVDGGRETLRWGGERVNVAEPWPMPAVPLM
jgi:hypothetical protein